MEYKMDDKNEFIHEAEIDSQTFQTKLHLPKGKGWGQ